MADLNIAGGVCALRATASQCLIKGCGGTYTCNINPKDVQSAHPRLPADKNGMLRKSPGMAKVYNCWQWHGNQHGLACLELAHLCLRLYISGTLWSACMLYCATTCSVMPKWRNHSGHRVVNAETCPNLNTARPHERPVGLEYL